MSTSYQIKYYRDPRPGKNSFRVVVQNMYTYEYLEDKEVYAERDSLNRVLSDLRNKYVPNHVCEVCY